MCTMYTVVWGKFTFGYFRVKIVCGKTFLSLGISEETFLTIKSNFLCLQT